MYGNQTLRSYVNPRHLVDYTCVLLSMNKNKQGCCVVKSMYYVEKPICPC